MTLSHTSAVEPPGRVGILERQVHAWPAINLIVGTGSELEPARNQGRQAHILIFAQMGAEHVIDLIGDHNRPQIDRPLRLHRLVWREPSLHTAVYEKGLIVCDDGQRYSEPDGVWRRVTMPIIRSIGGMPAGEKSRGRRYSKFGQ
jgi:hypothetical protein